MLRFCAAMDALGQGVVLLTEEQEVFFSNHRYQEIYGFSAEQVKPGTRLPVLWPRQLELSSAATDHVEHRLPDPLTPTNAIQEFADGRFIAYAIRQIPRGGWVATYEDVTSRETLNRRLKEQQNRLQARNLQFNSALNHMLEALCFFDEHQRLIVCNAQYAEMYRIPPAAIYPGITLREIVELRRQAGTLPAISSDEFYRWRNSVSAAELVSDTTMKLTDGRVLAIHHRPMAGGGWIATHRDITEHEQLHSQLKEQLEIVNKQKQLLYDKTVQFDLALNNISQGLCFFDSQEKLIICNNIYVEMYGLDVGSIVPGMTLNEIIELRYRVGSGPSMPSEEYHAWRKSITNSADQVVELQNGRTFKIYHRWLPGGGWVGMHEDITPQRKAEELNRQTMERLRATEAELRRAVVAAEASNQAKSSFLANMSHEIRTPLNGILGMAQVLANQDLAAFQQESVNTILESGQTLMALLNDVLDLSKIEAGKLDIIPIDGELENVFVHLQKLFQARAQEKSISLSIHIDPSIPKCCVSTMSASTNAWQISYPTR